MTELLWFMLGYAIGSIIRLLRKHAKEVATLRSIRDMSALELCYLNKEVANLRELICKAATILDEWQGILNVLPNGFQITLEVRGDLADVYLLALHGPHPFTPTRSFRGPIDVARCTAEGWAGELRDEGEVKP